MHHILVPTSWSYKDALIQTYTLPYLRIMRKYLPEGSKIFLVTQEQPNVALSEEEKEKVNKELATENIQLIAFPYHRFGAKAIWLQCWNLISLVRLCFREKVKEIHPWCTPAGSVGYVVSVLTGLPLVLDSLEPHAEPMLESGTWQRNGLAFRLLFWLEKRQVRRAKIAIACVEEMKNYSIQKYGAAPERFYAKPACVDFQLFSEADRKKPELLARLKLTDKVVGVYAGKFGGSYMIKEVFDFFKACEAHWGEQFRALLLNNQSEEEIAQWAEESGFDARKIVKCFVPHAEVPAYMGLGDFAITPFIPVPSKRYGTPIKTGEYLAMGLPIVIPPNISDDSMVIAKHQIGSIMDDFSPEGYEKNVQEIATLLDSKAPEELYQRIRAVGQDYRGFHKAEEVYKKVYAG